MLWAGGQWLRPVSREHATGSVFATTQIRDVRMALDVFSSVREWNVALVRSASPEALGKHVTHPERGEMTFQTVVDTMGGHDLNHVKQLEAIADRHR